MRAFEHICILCFYKLLFFKSITSKLCIYLTKTSFLYPSSKVLLPTFALQPRRRDARRGVHGIGV